MSKPYYHTLIVNWEKGLERDLERGFNNFFPLKGEFIREGGLIEDLWYASFFKSTISVSGG